MGDLSKHFSYYEIECKCGCGFSDLDEDLLEQMEQMRELRGAPMYINSGCRCVYHNKVEGGNVNSEHIDGQAVDIRVHNSIERNEIVDLAKAVGIKRIGVAKTFVHIDNDKNKVQDVLWLYT